MTPELQTKVDRAIRLLQSYKKAKLKLQLDPKIQQMLDSLEYETMSDIVSEGDGQTNTDEGDEVPANSDSNTNQQGNQQQTPGGSNTPTETPTDPTKILLLFNDGAHGNVIVKRMEVAPGYQLQASDLPDGYVYAFKNDDQTDIDAATAGEAVWVTLAPRG